MLVGPALEQIDPADWLAYISVPFVYCVVFTLLRETIILWLWHTINARLNANAGEQQTLIRSMV